MWEDQCEEVRFVHLGHHLTLRPGQLLLLRMGHMAEIARSALWTSPGPKNAWRVAEFRMPHTARRVDDAVLRLVSTFVAVDPSAKILPFCGFSGNPLISPKNQV